MVNVDFRRRLRSGDPVFGIITHMDSLDVVEMICLLDVDYLLIDGEHGGIGIEKVGDMLRIARGLGVPAVVRVRDSNPKDILRVCDLGADGIMIPQVESANTAREAVLATRYPPDGVRGLHGGTAAAAWGNRNLGEYIAGANDGILTIVQIETSVGVSAVHEILSVSGVDAVVVGPTDLSASYGVAGQFEHPSVEGAIQETFSAAADLGVAFGSLAQTPSQAEALRSMGASIALGGAGATVMSGLKALVDDVADSFFRGSGKNGRCVTGSERQSRPERQG